MNRIDSIHPCILWSYYYRTLLIILVFPLFVEHNNDMTQREYQKHYEETVKVVANANTVFTFADNPANFSSHMNKSSWMMGGSKMETQTDDGKGQQIGSHIMMKGNVFGISLFLDEVIIQHEAPYKKAWETVGKINLAVIDHYKLGFEITPDGNFSTLKVYIDYNLSTSWKTWLPSILFGDMYAKWCVRQMCYGIEEHFQPAKTI